MRAMKSKNEVKMDIHVYQNGMFVFIFSSAERDARVVGNVS